MSELATGLRHVPFFESLAEDQLAILIARGKRRSLAEGEVLFRKGDDGRCMYVILTGQVQIYLEANEGQNLVLRILDPGEFFGEMALLDGGARSASALAVTSTELFVLERKTFIDLLTTSPEMLSQMFSGVTQRLRATDERYLQEEIAKQTLRAETERERHRALAQMVAGVAHEVNTPLGIVNTAASIIKRELAAKTVNVEDLVETVDLMQKNITRANTLIQSFKNLSVSQVVDTKENVVLPEVVNETLELFSIQARKSNLDVKFTHTLAAEHPAWNGYRGHLSRILLNLLTNVERYAYPEGKGGTVAVTLKFEASPSPRYVLAVRDEGAGIAPEHLPKIFEPFFTTGRAHGGAGLGLSVVYNLVTAALHGTVTAESTLGQGATFTVTFPQVIPE